ncbi:hypothetical protein [Halalkalicoccus salilacus]|uniref:hypothetical protein n=1 Tax=Halalkalicoccus salilacus TaxID=3117459 RepID=UPI00300EECA5
MRTTESERGDRGEESGSAGSPYRCPECRIDIDPATTSIESGTIRGTCDGCGKTIDFADRSVSAGLAERWAIESVHQSASALQRDETRPVEASASEDFD